jgi:putative ABC transport system permease protein
VASLALKKAAFADSAAGEPALLAYNSYMFRYVGLMWKNALRNRRRSALTIVSLGFSLCLLGVLFALYRGLFLAPTPPGMELRLVTHHKVSITQSMPLSYEERIRHVPGVKEAMVWQWFGGTYKDARESKNFFARFTVEPDRFFLVRPEIQLPDDQKQQFQHLRTGAIASDDLVRSLGWKMGEKIFITGDIFPVNPELTLVGIFHDPNTTQTMFFNQEYLREMLGPASGRQDQIGAFEVQAENADAAGRIGTVIDQLFENSTAPTKTEAEQDFDLQFLAFLGNIKLFLMIVCAAVTFTILLVSANTVAMSVRERVREVGILKTLGFTPRAILWMILGEAGVISLLGGVIGIALASGLTSMVSKAGGFLSFVNTLAITPDVAALCLGLALFIGVASSVIPAWTAARTPILECLGHSG